ncbi:MAG: nucleotidyltransferase domain-containing protein, partial [PVC group bacterium]|nr:nucleotidyltransferase domain-containing protein [PVC group bacterium]
MITQETINQAVSQLAIAATPCKIILFGSYARNEATENSDLDLLVIKPQLENKGQEMVRLSNVIDNIG